MTAAVYTSSRYGKHINVPGFNPRAAAAKLKKQINEFIESIDDTDDDPDEEQGDESGNNEGGGTNNVVFIAPIARLFTFAGSVQVYNELLGEYKEKQVIVTIKCIPKKLGTGKLDVASTMGTSGDFEVIYLKIKIAGKELVEIDKYNYICKIDGVDYLAQTRKNMLMS